MDDNKNKKSIPPDVTNYVKKQLAKFGGAANYAEIYQNGVLLGVVNSEPEQRAKDAKYERLKERCARAVERLDPDPQKSSDAVWFKAELVCLRWKMVMDIRDGLLGGNYE